MRAELGENMYISKIVVKNFRRFDSEGIEVICNSGINIFLGENNIGKSALIDSLRLALMAGQYKRNVYVTPDDFHVDKYGVRADQIDIDVFFSGMNREQGCAFYILTDGEDVTKAELHLKYILQKDSKGNDKVREYSTGGPGKNPISSNLYDNINILYLPALRNAESDLKPARGSQLANILLSFASTDTDRQRVLEAFTAANEKVRSDPAIKAVAQIINKNLELIEKEELQQVVNVDLLEPTFEAIASSLDVGYMTEHNFIKIMKDDFMTLLSETGTDTNDVKGKKIVKKIDSDILEINVSELMKYPVLDKLFCELSKQIKSSRKSLRQNGLGYNNILSMAASLGDLQRKPNDEEISILLVEEPEAHLHPQLLDLLFNFFKNADQESKIQIFMTSHSPTLVAKSDIESLNVMYCQSGKPKVIALNQIGLEKDEKDDLKRYLDVTKSQFFFAKRVIFVEGISEALLLIEFAKLLKKPFDKYSVEIVNINGVAFKPFAKLFANNAEGTNIRVPCSIVSDNDKCTNNDDEFQINKKELVYSKMDIENLVDKLSKGSTSARSEKLLAFDKDNIHVVLAEKTLEYEMASIKGNNNLLLEILKTEHSDIGQNIEAQIKAGEEQKKIAIRFWVAMQDCKGTFSQKLASQINKISSGDRKDIAFVVPQYIQEAITHIIP